MKTWFWGTVMKCSHKLVEFYDSMMDIENPDWVTKPFAKAKLLAKLRAKYLWSYSSRKYVESLTGAFLK